MLLTRCSLAFSVLVCSSPRRQQQQEEGSKVKPRFPEPNLPLCTTSSEIFLSQPNLPELEAPIKICGKPQVEEVLDASIGHNYIGLEHLLLGLLREGEGVATRVLENLSADPSNIHAQVIRMVGESVEAVGAGVGGGSSGNKMPTLEEYGTNLTKLAEEVFPNGDKSHELQHKEKTEITNEVAGS